MKPGAYRMPNADYHAAPGLSSSGLRRFMRSPAHYQWMLRNPKPPTPDMVLGSAAHARILEPETYAFEYSVAPKCDRRTKAGKEAWASFEAENAARTILTAQQSEQVEGMAEAWAAFGMDLSSAFVEMSYFATDPKRGFLAKCRPDILFPSGRMLDLKTCVDASPKVFQRAIENNQYHVQAGWYCLVMEWLTGKPHESFGFVAIEKEPPHGIAVYDLDFRSLDEAKQIIAAARKGFARCLETNEWPGYVRETQTIGVRPWAL